MPKLAISSGQRLRSSRITRWRFSGSRDDAGRAIWVVGERDGAVLGYGEYEERWGNGLRGDGPRLQEWWCYAGEELSVSIREFQLLVDSGPVTQLPSTLLPCSVHASTRRTIEGRWVGSTSRASHRKSPTNQNPKSEIANLMGICGHAKSSGPQMPPISSASIATACWTAETFWLRRSRINCSTLV